MSVDPCLERVVLDELTRPRRRLQRRDPRLSLPRMLGLGLHHGHEDVLAHLHRVAESVPAVFRPVAWLHHAGDRRARSASLSVAGLSRAELLAIDLLADCDPLGAAPSDLEPVRTIAQAPGTAGRIARVVANAALADLLDTGHAVGEHLLTLRTFGEPFPAR